MSIVTDTEVGQQQRPPSLVTFYKLLCPQCGTLNVGDSLYGGDGNLGWQPGHPVHCRCGYWTMPETRKVDIAA